MRGLFNFCLLAFFISFTMCTSPEPKARFKVVGYIEGRNIDTASIPFNQLTHINFAFAIPAKDSGKIEPLQHTDKLKGLITKAHTNQVEVFLSVGGWGIGDGGGDDSRFHRLAANPQYRSRFVNDLSKLVTIYNLDGIDLDWEYPDIENSSANDYVLLMKELADSLHVKGKKLTAAVVHYGRQGDGINKEVFDIVDWLNLMAYDDDGGKPIPHSPYSLAEKSINYWTIERKLPPAKATLGLPFYGKPWTKPSSYRELIQAGADPMSDEFDSIFYNGIATIKKKTQLAKERGLAGVMIWEVTLDTQDKNSLLHAIDETAHPK